MLGAIAGSAVLAVAAPAASAANIPLSFNAAVLSAPTIGSLQVVSPSGTPIQATADVNTVTGQFTIAPGSFSAPTYAFTKPIPGTVTISLKGPASGQVDPANGGLEMTADFIADINLGAAVGDCKVDTGKVTMSTAATTPMAGVAFPTGETGLLTGTGAFGGGWASLQPGTGSGCGTVDTAIDNGPGGIWIARVQPETIAAKSLKLKKKKSGTLKATLTNKGEGASGPVKVCLKVPKGLKGSACKTVANIASMSSTTVSFKVKAGKKKHSYKATLTASSLGITVGSAKDTIKAK